MIGAGLFAAFAPATAASGSLLFLALAIAGFIALCNALSSATLAQAYPTSGGTYVYGRKRLGPWWGYIAGWSFLIGKTASLAAMALTLGHYLAPDYARLLAVIAIVAVQAVNFAGVKRSASLTLIIISIVLLGLIATFATAWSTLDPAPAGDTSSSLYGVLQGAGILFFAFAGYARIATMGEEVRDPARTIGRAILSAFVLVFTIYVVSAYALVHFGGYSALASTPAPFTLLTTSDATRFVLTVITSSACVGAMLGLVAGIGRTGLAMSREGDLPRAGSHITHGTPLRIDLIATMIVVIAVLLVDLRGAIGFSSCGVLIYYAIANASALTMTQSPLRTVLSWCGLLGCLVLVAAISLTSLVGGLAVIVVGILIRLARSRSSLA